MDDAAIEDLILAIRGLKKAVDMQSGMIEENQSVMQGLLESNQALSQEILELRSSLKESDQKQ